MNPLPWWMWLVAPAGLAIFLRCICGGFFNPEAYFLWGWLEVVALLAVSFVAYVCFLSARRASRGMLAKRYHIVRPVAEGRRMFVGMMVLFLFTILMWSPLLMETAFRMRCRTFAEIRASSLRL
jgi:hypothetical protein